MFSSLSLADSSLQFAKPVVAIGSSPERVDEHEHQVHTARVAAPLRDEQ
jgi:hypothetical protein